MENPQKVQRKQDELNGIADALAPVAAGKPQPWIHIQGYCAVTSMEFRPVGGPLFHPNVGVPLKAFLNNKTGEVKLFSAKLFED